jgi:DNA-binding CsgD family transcriptional regulator
MEQEEFDEKYDKITPKQKEVLKLFLKGYKDSEIATDRDYSDESTVRKHICNICRAFGITNDSDEDRRSREKLIELFIEHKYELVTDSLKPEQSLSLSFPSGAIPLDSSLYIERQTIETEIKNSILEPRVLIRISAPSKFGKTSLLNRLLVHAKTKKYRTVYLNLKQEIDQTNFSNIETFLRCLCTIVSEKLDLLVPEDDYWLDYRTPQINCNRYFETLLKQAEIPLLLVLDGVEKVYAYDAINREFFHMLRGWHDKASAPRQELWQRLRQVIVYSCENYGNIDLDRSPFNIGRHFELEEFTESEIIQLIERYQLSLSADEIKQMMLLIGGHPYLVNLALYHLVTHPYIAVKEFLKDASKNGMYHNYLCSLVDYLESNPDLKLALQNVINTTEGAIKLKLKLKSKLYSMGVIKFQGIQSKIRCELYRQYFQECL